jgi:hypothetical protein
MNLAAFRENLLKPSVKPRCKFLYDNVDKTSQILKIGTIRRDVNLSSGKAVVTLNNTGGWWNFLKAANNALGDTAEIQVYIEGDAANIYTLFKGTTRHPVYEGSTVTLNLKDHNSKFLDKSVGSNDSPVTYWQAQTWNADEVVWRLLTTHGGLSGLHSPANTNIDYTAYAAWRDNHIVANNYGISGVVKGQSVAECLMIICQMTHSYIWINNDGLVDFAPPHELGYAYAAGNTGSRKKSGQGRDLDMPDDKILNDVTVRHGYNFSRGSWTGSVNDTDATSIAKFGTFKKTVEGRIFWHGTSASATSDRDATLTDYAYPLRFFDLTAGVPAIMEDLGKKITVSDTLKDITNATPYVERIIYDLDQWEVKIKARWAW